jgi:hypothetical protein
VVLVDLENMVLKTERTVVIGDFQVPYHDKKAIDISLQFIRDYKPHNVVINADLVDFYPLSDFDKDPHRKADIQGELDMAHAILKKYRDAAPKAKMYLTYGNHEARLQRYLWKNPELECLRDLKLPKQLGLAELKIKFVGGTMDYWKTTSGHLKIGDAHIMHGDQRINGARGGARAGYAAMNTLLQMQTSVVMNHVHRLGMGYHNSPYAQLVAVEAGCMCQIPPGANWQKGFVSFETYEGKNRNYQLHQILKNQLIANGKLYKV